MFLTDLYFWKAPDGLEIQRLRNIQEITLCSLLVTVWGLSTYCINVVITYVSETLNRSATCLAVTRRSFIASTIMIGTNDVFCL